MTGDDLRGKVVAAFLVAIAAIIVFDQLGLETAWIPNLLGMVLYNLFVDAIGAVLAGAVGAAIGYFIGGLGLGTKVGASLGAVVTQILQLIFPHWLG